MQPKPKSEDCLKEPRWYTENELTSARRYLAGFLLTLTIILLDVWGACYVTMKVAPIGHWAWLPSVLSFGVVGGLIGTVCYACFRCYMDELKRLSKKER